MTTALLVLHIIGVAAWLGANILQAFAAPAASGADPAARLWWVGVQEKMGRSYYTIAGVLVLLTGVGLVLTSDDVFSFADTFVSIGFLAIIIGIVLGIVVFGPGSRKIQAAIDDGDEATEKATSNRLAVFGAIDSLVVIVTIVAMVAKW